MKIEITSNPPSKDCWYHGMVGRIFQVITDCRPFGEKSFMVESEEDFFNTARVFEDHCRVVGTGWSA